MLPLVILDAEKTVHQDVMVVRRLVEEGVPTDVAAVAAVESAYLNAAVIAIRNVQALAFLIVKIIALLVVKTRVPVDAITQIESVPYMVSAFNNKK